MSEIEDHDHEEAQQSAPQTGMRLTHRTPQRPVANPDDPPVQRPPRGPHGPLPGPRELGSPGRVAIVQGQVFLVGVILVVQLWLITDALFSLLSGHPQDLGWLTLASGAGFVIALIVWLWPRRRTRGL